VAGEVSLKAEGFFPLVEQGLKTLPRRYPGLRVLHHRIEEDRVELTLDLQRLDEDLQRIVQSFKSEVGKLARADGLAGKNLWQWSYEEI